MPRIPVRVREALWKRLFPDEDFRWSMNLRAGDAAAFFSPTRERAERLAERRRLLGEMPEHYALLDPGSKPLVADTLDFLEPWAGRFANLEELALGVESDWVLMEADADGVFRIAAGAVCFPSHWSLPEKGGKTLDEVHGPVPRLNDEMERAINAFLTKLAPGVIRERENWGLTADSRLDQHPRHERIRLDGTQALDAICLRLEQQLFARLRSGGLYFGIAVSHHRLDRLFARQPAVCAGMARALRTMPDDAAGYKGISEGRESLLRLFTS